LKDTLSLIFKNTDPDLVITFGPDGVTDALDHIITGYITDQVFDSINTGKTLLHMAISQTASYIYPIPTPVADRLIDLRVDISAFKRNRFKSDSSHRTQFGFGNRLFWRQYVRRFPFEEFIIVRNRDGKQILCECL
jgi:LmbE family N-acetylglucosaminyl deacetylase